jgi:hypothetical protein
MKSCSCLLDVGKQNMMQTLSFFNHASPETLATAKSNLPGQTVHQALAKQISLCAGLSN